MFVNVTPDLINFYTFTGKYANKIRRERSLSSNKTRHINFTFAQQSRTRDFSSPSPNPNHIQCQSFLFSRRGRCIDKRDLGVFTEVVQCFCEPTCELFQDCCADLDRFCTASGKSNQDSTYPDELWRCIEGGHMRGTKGIWMVSSCPTNWTGYDIKERCMKHSYLSYNKHKTQIPVIDKQGNTYKNHFCAQCNGLVSSDLISYNLEFECDSTSPAE